MTPGEHPAPDLIAPVVGFRQWRLGPGGLRSVTCDETWDGPVLHARCLLGGHPREAAPATACSCGVHAWYDPGPRTTWAPTRDHVAGAVVLWGAVELHATGLRAEHCRVVALALPLSRRATHDRVRGTARRFGIPVVRHGELREVAAGYGAPVPPGLRPPRRRTCDLASVDRYRTDDGALVLTPRGTITAPARRSPGPQGASSWYGTP